MSILTSGIGLGVYIPALLIQRRMRELDPTIDVEVEVLEGYFTEEHQGRHLTHKRAYHDNFDLARLAHRLARGVEESLDRARIEALLAQWATEGRRTFIVWSGFWLPILEDYRRLVPAPLQIDRCRIDAVVSASFRAHADLATDAGEIWLWHWEDRKTCFEIAVDGRPALPFSERDDRLVVHGGGWGLGTYRDAALALAPGWGCDVVVHDVSEVAPDPTRPTRFFMVDRDWRTWHRGPEGHQFPPFGEVGSPPASGRHALFDEIRRSKAIVSKPGGGTLIDSLASATPVVLLEPYGYAEQKNGELWEHLGYGIPYAAWRDTGFDPAVLERLHRNLLTRPRGPDYPARCVERIASGAWT